MENKNKYIGIDPGIRTTGWGIIVSENSRLKYLSHGIIENKKLVNDEFRLLNIFEKLTSIITSFKPNIAVVEQVFVSKNAILLPNKMSRVFCLNVVQQSFC